MEMYDYGKAASSQNVYEEPASIKTAPVVREKAGEQSLAYNQIAAPELDVSNDADHREPTHIYSKAEVQKSGSKCSNLCLIIAVVVIVIALASAASYGTYLTTRVSALEETVVERQSEPSPDQYKAIQNLHDKVQNLTHLISGAEKDARAQIQDLEDRLLSQINATHQDLVTTELDQRYEATHQELFRMFDVLNTSVLSQQRNVLAVAQAQAINITSYLTTLLAARTNNLNETIEAETEPGVCMSQGCVKAASLVMDAMDSSVDPCDDFFMYSCGSWIKKNLIPEDRSSISTFGKLRDELNAQLKDLLEAESSDSEPKTVLETREAYQACMNTDLIESRGVQPLYQLHETLGGWPMIDAAWNDTDFDLLTVLTDLRKLNNRYLIDIWVSADDRNSSVNIVQLDQFSFGLPNRDYFLLPSFEKVRDAYRTFMVETALYLNGTRATVEQDVDDVIEFETYLANITIRTEDRRDAAALYHRFSVEELYSNISDKFDWLVYMNKLFSEAGHTFTNESEVVVYSPVYLRQMIEKLQTTPDRTIANYLLWRITNFRITNLPNSIQDIQNKFKQTLYGISAEPPRWQKCVGYVNSIMGFLVGRMFVNKYFQQEAKQSALDMITGIRASFDDLLVNVDWMNDATRAVAKEKSAAIAEKIGYPDWINNDTALDMEYAGLEFHPDRYFENYLSMLRWMALQSFNKINIPTDLTRWTTTPAIVNAYYSSGRNQIAFPAGVLQPPFWQHDRPVAMNYGGIGMVIGHEITHGFDDHGRQFDKDGNLEKWWDQEVFDAFKEKAECIIDQYEGYVMSQINKTLNGINTQGENIADNGGIKQAYQAFLVEEEKNGPGQTLPGLPQLSSKKLFFMSFGQIWCSSYRDEGLKNAITTGVHSPGMYRVIGTLSNFEEFAKVFQCPSGSRMNPEKRCSVW